MQTREGSYTNDMVSPVSFELWRFLMTLEELICAFYVDEDSGPYLDAHGALLGLTRRAGTRAEAAIQFSGRNGITIPEGTAFFTAEGLEFDLTAAVTLENGTGSGVLRAALVGDQYNVAAEEISQILRSISGLEGFEAGQALGGTGPESDTDLFERIDFRRKHPSTSGNENHYREWALSCDGVGAAKVTRLWDGPGTVRVLVAGYDRRPVDEAVAAACAAYIESQRPVGAEVTVASVTGTAIQVAAAVVLDETVELGAVQAAFASELDNYLQELAFEQYTVYVNRIAALLMSIDGVKDYSNLTVNGGTENISIAETAVPVPGEVVLT